MKRFIPYLIPLASILIIISFLAFSKPTITGYIAIPELTARISLLTSEKDFLPETATISIYFRNQEAKMTVKEFISKSNQEYEYVDSENNVLDYKGKGFTGNYTYYLPLSEFDLNRSIEKGKYDLSVKVVYNNIIISERTEEIVV